MAARTSGRWVDLCKFARSRATIVFSLYDAPGQHYTWRDGERNHLTAEGGDLAEVGMDPDLAAAIRDHYGTAKRWMPGWERDWLEAFDVDRIYSRIFHADRLDPFRDAKSRPEARMTVELRADDGVEAAHYLCRPNTKAAVDFLAMIEGDPDVQYRVIDDWERGQS